MVKPKRAATPQFPDPITTEVVGSSLLAAAEEMGEILVRASYSANIKERRDSSSAILDARGGTIAQASHVPLHMGSMLGLGQAIIQRYPESEIRPGDVFITNDPYSGGGTHLPDITVAAPFFAWGKLVGFAANVAHHAEVGGAPSQTLDIYTEGLRIPLVRLYQEGKFRQDIMDFILLNCRLPDERQADLRAQAASVETGLQRLGELTSKYPEDVFFSCLKRLEEQAEIQAIQGIRSIPPGTYRFTDYMDNDGLGSEPVPITVALTVGDDRILCDFTGSSPQVRGPINLPYYATLAGVYYSLKAVVDPTLPANTGFYRTVQVLAPKGTIVNCAPPAPCLFRSDTAQRVVEVVLGALARADPERVVAASNGAVCGVYFLGYREDGSYYAYIETLGGGMGASTHNDGADGVQVHTTNTSNLPVEALELEYPMMVEQYELAADSGGPGRHRGGLGIIRQYKVLTDDIRVRTKGDRNLIAPWGLQGGLSGGRCRVVRNAGTPEEQELTPKEYDLLLKAGETIRFVTPGAGGYGRPSERALDDILRDVQEGKLSPRVAADAYKLSPEQLKDTAP